ncbi:hypothetical protein Cycma_1668 [Cyclobacterium marinum DSM 745]|jgi:hypothetical protein|uniref:Uncharacterized protein n=1 Tax=Cyclobacterium marinum (strain ATCC 25205 / DSM 745 / LMG 13164 / NCIMB 1802) TaxID=880070 RepID=G0IUN0_CYCMS|nr:hypothetical protein Cycma_1668 [Cyclobacterium marinum DSM 745]
MFNITNNYSGLHTFMEIIDMPIDLTRYVISLNTIRNTKITKNNLIQ